MSLPPTLDYAHAMAAMPARVGHLLDQLNNRRYAAAKLLTADLIADLAIVMHFLREQEALTPETKS
jgi:hypothetical protein